MKISNVMMRGGVGGSLLVAGLAMSACATDGAPTSAASNDPITEVSLDNGTKVSFFEAGQGAIAIGQDTAFGVAPVATEGMSAVQVYQSIAPGKPVPSQLADAQARSDQSRAGRPLLSAGAKAATNGGTASFTSSWFETNYCYNGGGFTFINCHADPLPTGNLFGTHDDVDEFVLSECTNVGKVTLSASIEGDPHLAVQIAAGHCYTYHWTSGLSNADYIQDSAVIDSATGQYGLAVKWNH